jgi:hypothetical protein
MDRNRAGPIGQELDHWMKQTLTGSENQKIQKGNYHEKAKLF